jgi:hypothetical protein
MMQLRNSWISAVAFSIALAFAACERPAGPPARLGLKLPPDALGASISVQQHLTVERQRRTVTLDVALEVDEHRIDLVGLAFGRRVLSLNYDGRTLTTWRDPVVPAALRGEDVLEDLQLTLWPAARISEVLP